MGHSTTANLGGMRAFAVQFGLLIVGGFSVLILFSFGGQVIVAPALLPAQWLIARNTGGRISMAFSILGAVLVAEVAWLAFALAVAGEEGGSLVVGLVGLAVAVGGGVLFFRTSRPPGPA
jgi:hypothetical protein